VRSCCVARPCRVHSCVFVSLSHRALLQAFRTRVAAYVGGFAVLKAAGFEKNEAENILVRGRDVNVTCVSGTG
jgi:hypothetical protein